MKKAEFLQMVQDELDTIKRKATKDEINNLKIKLLDVKSSIRCVYGLLTGRCDSPRALELMPKSFMFLTNFGACGIGFDNHSFDKGFKFTALEKYLVMVNREMHKKIIEYLKGEISEIELK